MIVLMLEVSSQANLTAGPGQVYDIYSRPLPEKRMKIKNGLEQKLMEVTDEIFAEVCRAQKVHTTPIHNLHEAHSVIIEEFDEFWEQVKINPRKLYEDDQKVRLRKIREELIQVAAMCVRTIIDLNL